jgi:hypothetical protein
VREDFASGRLHPGVEVTGSGLDPGGYPLSHREISTTRAFPGTIPSCISAKAPAFTQIDPKRMMLTALK